MCIYTYILAFHHEYMYACIYVCMYKYMHAYMHTSIHMHKHVPIYMCVHMRLAFFYTCRKCVSKPASTRMSTHRCVSLVTQQSCIHTIRCLRVVYMYKIRCDL